ncbi:MAG: bifunctional folylpolyglutamate synthase/dihydrofolate synthase [Planctomycetota bacterium]
MGIRTVDDALKALGQLTNYERTRADGPRDFDLARPRALLASLGHPERKIGARVIQVAGTKGKGSTARFADGILRAAGLRTGRFLSPHLADVRERIVVDGAWIPEEDFARCIERVLDAVDGKTTFFEALLAAACVHFAERETEAVVLEVGLGGRLDATTAVPATHTIITGIGLEHTEILGSTTPAIAAEKAGTIRFGVPVWSGVNPATQEGAIIRERAARREAPYTYVPPPADITIEKNGVRWGNRLLPVLGPHQAHNAKLAAACCHDLSRDAIDRGLEQTEQPGCCERRGDVIVDGAHTVESVIATLRAIKAHLPDEKPTLLFALAQDKDLDAIASLIAPHVGKVVCTQVDERRGRPAQELAEHPAWKARARAIEPLEKALAAARGNGLVLATGSMYLAGALRAIT